MSKYTKSLWQDSTAFELCLEFFIVAAAFYTVIVLLHKKGWISKKIFAVFLAMFVAAESYANVNIYMVSPSMNNTLRAANHQKIMDLSDRLDETEGFYRVKTASKLFEVNLVGPMGYNSLCHYTSLTSRDYMYMMKQLGYSSYWMEVGSYGGTELTDADLSGSEELSTGTRSDVQKKLFEQLFGGNGDELITDYEYTTIYGVQDDSNFKPNYTLNTTGDVAYMDYSIDVTDKQTLYFDCFDKLSNSLSEDINGSFMVTVNGQVMQMDYPSQSSNGLLKLGEFENEHVNVRATLKKDITSCRSYGVFGLHHNVLEKALEQAQTAGLTDSDGKLSGSVNAKAGQKCVLQIPYQEGLKIKVNGKAVSYDKVFGDLVSFDLQEGENTITVTSVPNGFYAGLILTIAGIALTVGYFFIRKKLFMLHLAY